MFFFVVGFFCNKIKQLKTAHQLFQELKFFSNENDLEIVILGCYILMYTNRKPEIEKALNTITKVLEHKPNFLPGLLAAAIAFVLLNQVPRAVSRLKLSTKEILYTTEFQESTDMQTECNFCEIALQMFLTM